MNNNMEKDKTAKQLAIEQAYGEHYKVLKDYINDVGQCQKKRVPIEYHHIFNFDDFDFDMGYYAPKSIGMHGIQLNNGWFRIESEEDLPKDESVKYKTGILSFDGHFEVSHIHFTAKTVKLSGATHYKPIKEEPLPIY